MKTTLWIIGILALIGGLGYVNRGWFDFLGLGAMALLVVPIVIAVRSE